MSGHLWRNVLWVFILIWLWAFGGCAGPGTEKTPDSKAKSESLVKMGDVYFREEKYRNAMKNYLEADEIDPQNAELKFRIALIYSDFYKKNEEAIRYYQEAINLKENYSEAYNNLGTIYARQGEWDLAIESFEKALDNLFYATPEKAYYNIASAYQGKGDLEKAVKNYTMAIELRPEYVTPYLQLALLYQNQGQHEKALSTLRQARYILEKDEPKKGKVTEDQWQNYQTTVASIYYHQALSLAKLGRNTEAKEAFEKALESAPEGALRERVELELKTLSQ